MRALTPHPRLAAPGTPSPLSQAWERGEGDGGSRVRASEWQAANDKWQKTGSKRETKELHLVIDH